jgi:hypothetical protein
MPPGRPPSRKPPCQLGGESRFLESAWTARAYTNSIRGAVAPESGSPHCPWRSGSSRDRGIGTLRAPVIRHRRRTASQIHRPNHRARTWMELPLPTAAGAAEGDEPERPELMIKNRRRSRGESRRSGAGPGNGDERVGGREGGVVVTSPSRRRAAAARSLGWLAGWLRRSGREGEESCGRHSTVGKRKRGRHATRRRRLPGRAGGPPAGLRLLFPSGIWAGLSWGAWFRSGRALLASAFDEL